jgi:hypothetical protein
MIKNSISLLFYILIPPIFLVILLVVKHTSNTSNLNSDYPAKVDAFETSIFDVSSSKDFYFKINDNLFASNNRHLDLNSNPIWKGNIEELFVSPNGSYAVIFNGNATLIDKNGNILFESDEFTELIPTKEERQKNMFLTPSIQWDLSSKSFFVIRDKYIKSNKISNYVSSIYKYEIETKSFHLVHSFDHALDASFSMADNNSQLYYMYYDSSGSSVINSLMVNSGEITSIQTPNYGDKIQFFSNKSAFYNFNDYKQRFYGNAYSKKGVVDTRYDNNSQKLVTYYADPQEKKVLLTGIAGHESMKGTSLSYYYNGYFLPGDRYFIPNMDPGVISGQLIIDTKLNKTMQLKDSIEFYFNINSNDYRDIVYFLGFVPNLNSFELDKYL